MAGYYSKGSRLQRVNASKKRDDNEALFLGLFPVSCGSHLWSYQSITSRDARLFLQIKAGVSVVCFIFKLLLTKKCVTVHYMH